MVMTETIRHNYECYSREPFCIQVPYARLTDTTPTPSLPAELTSLTPGTQLTGTIISIDAGDSVAMVDVRCANVYYQKVRNVRTYDGATENTWGVIDIGDMVYYDNSATMPVGVYLSTSPLDNLGVANTLFGTVVPCNDADRANYPTATATAATEECGVCQRGAGV